MLLFKDKAFFFIILCILYYMPYFVVLVFFSDFSFLLHCWCMSLLILHFSRLLQQEYFPNDGSLGLLFSCKVLWRIFVRLKLVFSNVAEAPHRCDSERRKKSYGRRVRRIPLIFNYSGWFYVTQWNLTKCCPSTSFNLEFQRQSSWKVLPWCSVTHWCQ